MNPKEIKNFSEPETIDLTFDILKKKYAQWESTRELPHSFSNQYVVLRGFLYKNEKNWVLAGEPNLKSCCIGNNSKKGGQLAVFGTLPQDPLLNVVKIKGQLHVSENSDFFYTLYDAAILENVSNSANFDSTAFLFFGIFIVGIILWKNRKKNELK